MKFQLAKEEIAGFCKHWKIVKFEVFGSALHDDFGSESDVDILVSFASNAHWGLFDLAHMKGELEALLGREVDLITRRAIETSSNSLRRDAILSSAEAVYVA